MRKIMVIAAREYSASVKTKSFLIGLFFMPVLMGGSIGLQILLEKMDDTEEKRFAVVDRTPGEQLLPMLEAAVKHRNANEIFDEKTGEQDASVYTLERVTPSPDDPDAIRRQRLELSERVETDQLEGFIEIGPEVLSAASPVFGPAWRSDDVEPRTENQDDSKERASVRYQGNKPKSGKFQRWAEPAINRLVQEWRCAQAGIDRTKLQAVFQPVKVQTRGLSKRNAQTGVIEDISQEVQVMHFIMPAAMIGMMFFMIMVGATPLVQGIVEEKMQRIAEVLLGSVQPFQLMMGKLIGMTAVSLTLAAVYLGGAYVAAIWYGFADQISTSLIAWFVLYQILAMLMHGSLFVAVGAACTDSKEVQTLLLPVMTPTILPMMLLGYIVQEPHSALSVGISLFPLTTPMLMLARQAAPPGTAWWEPVLGISLVLATTVLCVYVAGRIFRVGILMQGKGPRFSDLARWVIRG